RGRKHVATVGGAVAVALLAACSSSSSSSSSSTGATSAPAATSSSAAASGTLNGAGSTFQLTFQQAAISGYKSVASGVTVNYDGVGSGSGRADLYAGTVNYAGSDSTIPATEESKLNGKKVLYFPVLIGPIDVAYNLPGISNLKLSPKVISDIFQAKVTTWNASEIKSINPGVNLPSTPITLAVRSDSSGTTQNFTLFLQDAVGSAWALGSSSTVKWPSTAHAASGNGGVATTIKSTAGAIGYVDYSTAQASNLTAASVENKAGKFVAPSTTAASAAAAGVTVKPDLTFHAVWASTDPTAYPITYQSWDIVYAVQPNATDVSLLKGYLGFLLGQQGQALLAPLHYAPLPSNIDSMATAQLSQITS
ncbi:MAG TPA: phosphate ABC transporter substrate-binding protein PstS, partial [Trebonia sp.]|nr:phosphate ABC transporter substrate-binding protein PstS [Trebonia sp.]